MNDSNMAAETAAERRLREALERIAFRFPSVSGECVWCMTSFTHTDTCAVSIAREAIGHTDDEARWMVAR